MAATHRRRGGSYAGLATAEDPELKPRVEAEVARRRRLAGDRIREAREAKDVTREGLSTATGLGFVTIGRIERGESGSEWSYGRIAAFLELPPDWLGHLDEAIDTGMADELLADRIEDSLTILGRLARLEPPEVDAIRQIVARAERDRRRGDRHAHGARQGTSER